MAAISYPTTGRDAYLTDPWEAPNGSKWTWGGDAKPRWTAWSEPPLTEIAWGEVNDKPAAVIALSGTNTGDQDLSGLASTSALSSGLDGKSPTAGSTSIVTLGTVTTGTWNGTTIAVANGGTGATTAAAARNNLSAASKREYKTANFTAESYGRYVVSSGGTVVVSNPPTGVLGDPFEVVIATGNATINGVTYAASRFPIEVVCTVAGTPGTWTTPAATVTGAFNATNFSGNGSGITNLSWAAIGGSGTAASPSFTAIGATTPGTGAFTTVTASGTVSGNGSTLNGINLVLATDARLSRRAAGIMMIDQNGTANGALVLASNTSSGVSIKRSGTTLQVRLGDDSADAPLSASNLTASGTLTVTGATTLTGGVSSFGNAAAVATTFENLKGAHFDRHVCSPTNWQLGWTSATSTVAGTGSTTATSHGANASSGATASSRGQLALPGTVTMFASGSTTDSRYIDWSKRVTIGFALTMIVDATANGQCYLKIGSSSATGDLASRSIGIRVNRYALVGQCHNGTTLTTSATLYTFSGVNVCAYITLQSDGAGNVAVYINGSLVATMTGGPTTEGALTSGVYFEVLNNADAANNRWQVSPINYRCNSFNS